MKDSFALLFFLVFDSRKLKFLSGVNELLIVS